MSYSLYIVCCADGTLYTGIAVDVARRVLQHNGEKRNGARYTSARRPVRLVYQAPSRRAPPPRSRKRASSGSRAPRSSG